MSLNPSANFVAKNDLAYKTPMYVAEFESQSMLTRSYEVMAISTTDITLGPDVPYLEPGYFATKTIEVLSGALVGQIFRIEDNLTNTLTMTEDLEDIGLSVGDTLRLRYTYKISGSGDAFVVHIEQDKEDWETNDMWVGKWATIYAASGWSGRRKIINSSAFGIVFTQSLPNGAIADGDEFEFGHYESFCTYVPVQTTYSTLPKPYISYISGGGYSITPDEGSTSSSTIKIELQDKNQYVTQMIHNSTGRLQKKECTVKAGYIGLKEEDMLTVFTGEVTDYQYKKDGAWEISVSDSIRALNKNLFRGSADDNVYEITGNPITLALALLISKDGDGTKGQYDFLPSGYGLDMPVSKIDVDTFENIRDTYYPTTSATFHFEIKEQISANDFLKDEIYKPLNMYPIVKGNGQYSATIYRPILPPYSTVGITEDDMLDIPTYDGNLPDLINEVQFSYNYDGDDYQLIDVYADAESINARGVGDRTLEIESKGISTDYMPDADGFIARSATRVFSRYATPPIKLSTKVMFKQMLIESGDIISVSNKYLPNLDTGAFDLENVQMEVLKRTVDWKRGSVNLELLQTGYEQNKYAAISPEIFVLTPIGDGEFETDDISSYEVGFECSVYRIVFGDHTYTELIADDISIVSIGAGTTNTYQVITDPIGETYTTDMVLVFNDTGTLASAQEPWGRIGAGYLITP